MKRKLRGMKRRDIQLDFDLYRVNVPIRGISRASLSVVDLWPEGAKETIMFVHGYAGCLETWEFQINYFARTYRVVAPDLRGHGQSDAPFTEYTMAEMVDDLHAIVQHLSLPERFVLVGHSFGGSICVEYANAHPERLSKLILIATAGEYPLPRRVTFLYKLPNAFFRPWWKYRPRWNAEIHVLKRMMSNNMNRWQGWSLLRNISTPTLVITGERDSYFPRHVFDEVGRMIPGAEIYDVGTAKHKVQLERHEAVNRGIERFIQGEQRQSWRGPRGGDVALKGRIWLKSYSKETPPTIPIPRRPLYEFLESAADWVPKRTATLFYGADLSYQLLNQLVNQFAHVLHGMGIKPGDRVTVVLPNVPQLVVAYYAILKIGGVVVLPNADADATTVVRQVRETGSRVLITLRSFSPLAKAVSRATEVERIIFADIRNAISGGTYRRLVARWGVVSSSDEDEATIQQLGQSMQDLMRDAPPSRPQVSVSSTDLATIIYTSGTTDQPKGVCLSHSNLVANTLQTRHWIPGLEYGQEVFLSVVPLLHSYGMTNAMNIPIAMGATIVLLPVFEVQQVLEHIKKYRPSVLPGVPSMYTAINQAPNVRSYGLSSIKACVSGSAPLPIEVQEAFEKLTRGHLVEGYGLTEAAPVTHGNPLYGVRKPGSIGVPLPNTDARIVDLVSDQELPPGQVGELVIKGPQVMLGYWEADQRIHPEEAIRDGWLYTGDVAVYDDDGYFQIISRKRDTIFAGDYSVYPRDVEEVLYENNKVMEVAVVGVETQGDGRQKVKAFVVPRPGTNLTEEELLALCRRRLEPYAVPWEIEFRDELPKSFVGKVLRRMLMQEAQGQSIDEGEGE